jgi:uncharacterized membrane protein YeaQ/YmgE (transglycosylase-associated protein family)
MIEVSITTLLIWLIIAAMVGFLGELLARRRATDGLVGATLLGFVAIFLVVGILRFRIAGEPDLAGVPLISSILVAALISFVWSAFAYNRVYRPRYERYYRRGTYARRPRRRWFSR